MEFILGRMAGDMKENIKMIKKRDVEFINGLMVGSMMECGKMVSKMEMVCSFLIIIQGREVYGKKGRD